MTKKFWHEISEKEVSKIYGKQTWGWVMEKYKQPVWCDYCRALDNGCWSLLSAVSRTEISRDYCKNCKKYIPEVKHG